MKLTYGCERDIAGEIEQLLVRNFFCANPNYVKPTGFPPLKVYSDVDCWDGGGMSKGYPFPEFLADFFSVNSGWKEVDGMQQLAHHYYSGNGRVNGRQAGNRAKAFLGDDYE
jgi:hypothetical protein